MTTRSSTSATSPDPPSPVSIGFIGCGTIASAIATGLATQTAVPIRSIAVTRRSEKKSSQLLASFGNLVTVHEENQEVLDRSDYIFLTVLPQQTSQVLQALSFDVNRHVLVSLVSTSQLTSLQQDSGLNNKSVFKMICLPAVAKHQGVCLLTPKQDHPVLLPLCQSLGGCVQATDEAQMAAMMVPSGLMGSLYGVLRNNREWLVKQGVAPKDASYLVGRYYWGMMQDAERDCDEPNRFDELVAEQTPGGLNEQALGNLQSLGVMQSYDQVQDAMLARIQGKSDGSL